MNTRPSKHAHWMVRDTAIAMCHELYDHLMQEDMFYRLWIKQNPGISKKGLEDRFIANNLGKMIPQARSTLANMLATSSDEKMKEEIYEALILDATLIRGRVN